MPRIILSITTVRGTASVTLNDAGDLSQSSILLRNSFREALPISTIVNRSIVGSAVVSGYKTDAPLIWSGVEALLNQSDYLTLKAAAMKSDNQRQDGNDLTITLKDEFYPYVEEGPTNTRAIATGGVTAIGSTGAVTYYAAYNVAIVNFETVDTNLYYRGAQAFEVSFDMVELDKLEA